MKHFLALVGATVAALAVSASAFAHAHVNPPVSLTGESQVYTVIAPNEENVAITKVELTPPDGFRLSQPAPAPGWKIDVTESGTGDEAKVEKITWSGGNVPAGQAAVLQFLGSAKDPGTYAFKVRQTYADGTVADWAGPESSDTPAPTIETKASLAGGGGSNTLSIVAIVIGGIGIVLGAVALLGGRGARELA